MIRNHQMHEIKKEDLKWVAPENGDLEEEFILSTVEQVYFFLKDLCHEHQHHDAKSDSLLPLIESKNGDIDKLYEEVLKSLYRVALKKRRERSVTEYKSISGILVYIKSFKSLMKKRAPKLQENFCNDGDNFLSESIQIKSDQLELIQNKKSSFSSILPTATTLSISLVAITFSVTSPLLFYISKQKELEGKLLKIFDENLLNSYLEFIGVIFRNPIGLFPIFFMISIALVLFMNPWFWELKVLQDFKRLGYAIGYQKVQAIFLVLTGLTLILCGLYILI